MSTEVRSSNQRVQRLLDDVRKAAELSPSVVLKDEQAFIILDEIERQRVALQEMVEKGCSNRGDFGCREVAVEALRGFVERPTVQEGPASSHDSKTCQDADCPHCQIERLRAALEQLDADASCEKAEKESLRDQLADYRAAYNRVATAARAVTAELYNVGVETDWRDGDETDRVFAWYEMLPLVKALDADIHRSSEAAPPAETGRTVDDIMCPHGVNTYIGGVCGECSPDETKAAP
jgi:hypothetical protein